MRLLIKTDLEMLPLAEKLNELRCAGEPPATDGEPDGEASVGFLMPPDMGRLTLYQNSNPVRFEDAAEWPFVLQVENIPGQSKPQAELAWTQLKMLGAYLRANSLASEVLAQRFPVSGIERALSE